MTTHVFKFSLWIHHASTHTLAEPTVTTIAVFVWNDNKHNCVMTRTVVLVCLTRTVKRGEQMNHFALQRAPSLVKKESPKHNIHIRYCPPSSHPQATRSKITINTHTTWMTSWYAVSFKINMKLIKNLLCTCRQSEQKRQSKKKTGGEAERTEITTMSHVYKNDFRKQDINQTQMEQKKPNRERATVSERERAVSYTHLTLPTRRTV